MTFRNSFGGRGLVAAMEDENDDVVEVAEPEVAAETAESALLEAEGEGAAVLDGVEQIESTEADADTLTAVADQLESTEEEGGLDPQAAAVTEIALEAIYTRVGIRKHKLPAVEAYNEKGNSRIKATRIAVEDIRAKVKQIWAAIVDAFNKVIEWIKNFLKSIFDGATKLRNRAAALVKSAAANKGVLKEGASVKGSFLNVLTDKSGFSPSVALEVVKAVPENTNAVDDILSWIDKSGLANDADKLVKEQAAFDAFTIDKLAASGTGRGLSAGGGERGGDGSDGQGMTRSAIATLPGGRRMYFVGPSSSAKGADALGYIARSKIEVSGGEVTGGKSAESSDPLSSAQITEFANAVVDALDTIVEVTNPAKVTAFTGKTLGGLVAKAKSLANVASEEDKTLVTRSNTVGGAVRNVGTLASKARTIAVKEGVIICKAALDYAEASLKQYGEAEAPAEKKDDKAPAAKK